MLTTKMATTRGVNLIVLLPFTTAILLSTAVKTQKVNGGMSQGERRLKHCLQMLSDGNLTETYTNVYIPLLSRHWKNEVDPGMDRLPYEFTAEDLDISCRNIERVYGCMGKAMKQVDPSCQNGLDASVITSFNWLKLGKALCKNKEVWKANIQCIRSELLKTPALSCGLKVRWDMLKDEKSRRWGVCQGGEEEASDCEGEFHHCLYPHDEWKAACGSQVHQALQQLSKDVSTVDYENITQELWDRYIFSLGVPKKPDFAHVAMLHYMRSLQHVWPAVKSCGKFPLGKKTFKRDIRRRDALQALCHRVTYSILPRLEPILGSRDRKLAKLQSWAGATQRICKMGYSEFHDITERIQRCTNGEDELYECYKGSYLGLSQAAFLFGLRDLASVPYGKVTLKAYRQAQQCAADVYRDLRSSCGNDVTQALKDIREMMTINIDGLLFVDPDSHMFSVF